MRSKGLVLSVVLALVMVLMGSTPALAEEPPLADIESEIDAVQWGIVYQPKDGWAECLESLKLLVVLEIADKFVEQAMAEYAEADEVTDEIKVYLNSAVDWLERAAALSEGGGIDISSRIDMAVRTEVCKEEVFGRRGWLKEGDTPWTGDSMEAYGDCTTVDSYIETLIARIGAWLLEQDQV